jgi:hypothetical protein
MKLSIERSSNIGTTNFNISIYPNPQCTAELGTGDFANNATPKHKKQFFKILILPRVFNKVGQDQ